MGTPNWLQLLLMKHTEHDPELLSKTSVLHAPSNDIFINIVHQLQEHVQVLETGHTQSGLIILVLLTCRDKLAL